MTPELRGKLARAICEADGCSYFVGDTYYERLADALAPIIAEVEAAAVERCAKVAENEKHSFPISDEETAHNNACDDIAAAIRAQKEPSA